MTLDAAQIAALLEWTTPGPWTHDGPPTNKIIWSSAENRVCFMAHSNGLDDERDEATARLIAAAPDLARAALDAIAAREAAERERDALREALADTASALEKFIDVGAEHRAPYEHPLSAYDRAMDALKETPK